MRIFFAHQFYRTPKEGGCIRSFYVIQELLRRGHEVILLRDSNDPNPEKKNYTDAKHFDQLEIICLPVKWSNSLGFVNRIKAFTKYLFAARNAMNHWEFDMVYSVSVPLSTGLLALWSKKPYVFEVGDLWPDVPVQMGILKNPVLKWYSYRLEKKIYKKAELIISLSSDIARIIYSKCPESANIIIPNFSDKNIFGQTYGDHLHEEFGIAKEKTILSYTGTAGIANDLMQFVELARLAENEYPNLHFCIMAEGKELSKINSHKISNLTFVPFGDKWKAAKLLAISDFNFVCYANFSLLGTGSPNKFFDGLASSCVTVINVKGWISRLIEEEQAGIYWNPESPETLLRNIQALISNQELKSIQKRSLRLSDRFDYAKLSSEIVNHIEMRF